MKTKIFLSFLMLILLSSCYTKDSSSNDITQEPENTNISIEEDDTESWEDDLQEEQTQTNSVQEDTSSEDTNTKTQTEVQIVSDIETESFMEANVSMTWKSDSTVDTTQSNQQPKEESKENVQSEVAQESKTQQEVKVEKTTDQKLRERLTSLQYEVTQNGATEKPYENKYWDNYEEWIYVDIIDGTPLFSSTTKFKSNTGWPSFTKPISGSSILELDDNSLWFTRIEAKSASSNSHLWHIFNDGPQDQWWLRYCINSAALRFVAKADMKSQGYQNYLYLFE